VVDSSGGREMIPPIAQLTELTEKDGRYARLPISVVAPEQGKKNL
jgi:hypothetical protein